MNLNQKVTFADTVFAQEVDGEMVLLDMQSENYFGLDEVGTVIWQAMQEQRCLKDILLVLMEQYDVKEDILEKDLLTFTHALVENGLIEVDDKC
jgi:ornithine carbamoyltransferase